MGTYRMSPEKIKESLQTVTGHFERFADSENPEEQLVIHEILISSVKQLLKELKEKA